MDTAYYTLDEKTMGNNFDFKKWSESWLITSGVNTLTPIVTFDDAGKLTTFQIQQTFDQYGQNLLRAQQLEIAFFDE
jgi:aminopeptidase N